MGDVGPRGEQGVSSPSLLKATSFLDNTTQYLDVFPVTALPWVVLSTDATVAMVGNRQVFHFPYINSGWFL